MTSRLFHIALWLIMSATWSFASCAAFAAQPQDNSAQPRVPDSVIEPSLIKVPDLLDNLYRYNVNSTSDLVTYEKNGTLVQLYSYWASDRRLHITERQFPNGEFADPIDIHDAVSGTEESLMYDSHNSSAIGVASNGTIFVVGNQHVNELNMARTTKPYDLNSLVKMNHSDMVAGTEANRVTYPSFFNHGGFLYFSYREQEVGKGAPRHRWMLNRYDPEQDRWNTAVQFNTGIGLRLYISHIAMSHDQKTLHTFGVWRDDTAGGGVNNHRDYFHLYSTDGLVWKTAKSDTYVTRHTPLWYDNGNKKLAGYTGTQLTPEENIWTVPYDRTARGAGSAAVDSSGNPHSLVKDLNGGLYHLHHNQTSWQSRKLIDWEANSFDLVACPDHTGAVLSRGDKVYYRSLDHSVPGQITLVQRKQNQRKPILLAEGFTTSKFSLSIDKKAIQHGYVSFLLTSNTQFAPRKHTVDANPQPAWIATYHCDRLQDATFVRSYR